MLKWILLGIGIYLFANGYISPLIALIAFPVVLLLVLGALMGSHNGSGGGSGVGYDHKGNNDGLRVRDIDSRRRR